MMMMCDAAGAGGGGGGGGYTAGTQPSAPVGHVTKRFEATLRGERGRTHGNRRPNICECVCIYCTLISGERNAAGSVCGELCGCGAPLSGGSAVPRRNECYAMRFSYASAGPNGDSGVMSLCVCVCERFVQPDLARTSNETTQTHARAHTKMVGEWGGRGGGVTGTPRLEHQTIQQATV